MDWESQLSKEWQGTTFEGAKQRYTPILVRALSEVCPDNFLQAEAEDIIVAIVHETFAGVRKVFRFLPHEVAFLEEITQLATGIAVEMKFRGLVVELLERHVVDVRFEFILLELSQKIVTSAPEDRPKLIAARERVLELYLKWRNKGREPKGNIEPPSSAPSGAWTKPPVTPKSPGIGRTIWEAKHTPRQP